jgi:hypothetical protein
MSYRNKNLAKRKAIGYLAKVIKIIIRKEDNPNLKEYEKLAEKNRKEYYSFKRKKVISKTKRSGLSAIRWGNK